MQIAFIEQDKTELGAKKEELESVDRPLEDRQQPSVKKKRSKLKKMKELEIQLRANLGLAETKIRSE
jgi:hypothetical protein